MSRIWLEEDLSAEDIARESTFECKRSLHDQQRPLILSLFWLAMLAMAGILGVGVWIVGALTIAEWIV